MCVLRMHAHINKRIDLSIKVMCACVFICKKKKKFNTQDTKHIDTL